MLNTNSSKKTIWPFQAKMLNTIHLQLRFSGAIKFSITLVLTFCMLINVNFAQSVVGVGAGQTYVTLADAFAAVNSGTLTGSIRFEIRDNVTQNTTALLNASGTGSANYSTISIYPTGNYSITANIDGPVLELAGADRVTIDGRINGTTGGSPYNLVLENTNTGINASLLHIRDGGNTNNIQYAVLKGAGGSSTRGMFSLDGSGNSVNNIVQYCRITNSGGNRPYSVYYINTSGSSGAAIFFGNEVFDIFRSGGDTKAVIITGTHTLAYIMNNHFYETAPINVTGSYTCRAISIEGVNATGVLVQGNIIGGSQTNAGGSPMTFTSASAPQFDAIYVSGGSSASPTSIQANTITNISFQSSKLNVNNIYSPGYFNAIYVSGADTYANIGDVTGNIIGSQSGTGAIQLFPTNTTQYCPAVMIFVDATGTVTVQNNTIGGITSTGTALAKSVIGILNTATSGTHLISGNVIGSPSITNSIEVGANSLNTSVNELVWGIASLNISGNYTISENTIANITQQETGPHPSSLKQVAGIFLSGGGNTVVNNNTVHHITSSSNMLYGGEFSSVLGIDVYQNVGTVSSISGNTIYELHNANTANLTTEVTGIFFKGNTGSAALRNNFIHSLRLSSSNSLAKIVGMHIGASNGVALLSNNVISLGTGISNGFQLNGILDNSQLAGNANKFYYNTIYLGGDAGAGNNTAALYLGNATPSGREIINNILVNERRNIAGSASHYGLYVMGTPSLTADFNDYYAPNAGGMAGYFSTNKTALPVVTGQDASSLIQNPGFASAGGSAAIHYIPSNALPGTFIAGYEMDFLAVTRPASPYMGAFYYSEALPVTWLGFTARQQGGNVELEWSTASEESSKDFVIQHSVNAVNWTNIDEVLAGGNSSIVLQYQFIHTSPALGDNYYRILQRDIDDRFSYSIIRRVEVKVTGGIQILGNPVVGEKLAFKVNEPIELSLLSMDGRVIWRKKFSAGFHQENLQMLSLGIYYLRSGNETKAFVK